ncbi:Nodulation-signaling pathway 1 protein [Hibiscus syriacus]|uniref:Nodulation-signaling pathway 1 protein n=1 Tax=Hibiscus syriacus TaxID=106335 RepID=A0A6A2XIG0_HIBSY|nr:Nodulation-signaling pathway 1 protein [Hibiscus syriacus]
MGLEESAEPNPIQDHILDWLDDSASFLPTFLDFPYASGDVDCYPWWDPNQEFGQHLINLGGTAATSSNSPTFAAGAVVSGTDVGIVRSDSTVVDRLVMSNLSKRRKPSDDDNFPKMLNHQQQHKKNHNGRINENEEGKAGVEEVTGNNKRSAGNKKTSLQEITPDNTRTLHILDIGVSHGVQWPTLLEALSRRSRGPPPLVRITVVVATAKNNQITDTLSRSVHPVMFAHSLDFRLHRLDHNGHDQRTGFLKVLRSLEPKGVILSENNMDCSCSNCGDFAKGFSRRVEYLRKFLDSSSLAFKGRESEEGRVMEGEAAKALTNQGEMNEGKEKWCERMQGVGFVTEVFGEDAIDGL